jgi:2-polyprenyl-6-methoxyphenol hydroxylase-like FAD-dependent oxidoreductase
MHGIMLHHNGYAVTILEQDTASRREGFDAGIRVGPDFVSLLKKYDRIDRPYEIHATGYQDQARNASLILGTPREYPARQLRWDSV